MSMTKDEYLEAQTLASQMAVMVSHLPLTEMLDMIERSETTGPLLDPTPWLRAYVDMSKVKELLQALISVKQVVVRQNAEVKEKRAGGKRP